MAEIAIGIDLGTSNSCVATARNGAVEVHANAYGESTTASVVAFRTDGSIIVGNAAKANIIHNPKETVYSAKRLIGRYFFSEEVKKARAICSYEIVETDDHAVRVKVRDEVFSLPELSGMVLRELKTIAEARLGQPITKAVITVPAYFNDNQRQATKDAGRIAGLEVLRILNEPTAAALSYGFGRGLTQKVAVYDLGGGTFDISVLEIGEDVYEVLSTCGDTFLGGDDFDDRLIDLLADEFTAKEGVNLRNDPYALEKLKVAAEGAKKALSVDSAVDIRIPDIIEGNDGPLSVERSLSEAEYGSLVQDLIVRSFKVCDEAIGRAGVVARDLDGVVLVGGPTRLPIVRNAVAEYFQQEPKADVDPDLVVAMGAAIHASTLVDPSEDAYLLDVTPLSLKIGVAGGLAETVIERNTPVPIEQTRTFTTFKDYQESVAIRVYQGESVEAKDNEPLGQFEFSGFDKGRRGEVAIDVTFEINADGIVEVTARDTKSGQEASTRITLSSGLTDGEIETILEEARTDRLESPDATPSAPPAPIATRASEVDEALAALPLSQPDLGAPVQAAAAAAAAAAAPAPAPQATGDAPLLTPSPEAPAAAPEPVIQALPEPADAPLVTPSPRQDAIAIDATPVEDAVIVHDPLDELAELVEEPDVPAGPADAVTQVDGIGDLDPSAYTEVEPVAAEAAPAPPVAEAISVAVEENVTDEMPIYDEDFEIEPMDVDIDIDLDADDVVELTEEIEIATAGSPDAQVTDPLLPPLDAVDIDEGAAETELFGTPGTDLSSEDPEAGA